MFRRFGPSVNLTSRHFLRRSECLPPILLARPFSSEKNDNSKFLDSLKSWSAFGAFLVGAGGLYKGWQKYEELAQSVDEIRALWRKNDNRSQAFLDANILTVDDVLKRTDKFVTDNINIASESTAVFRERYYNTIFDLLTSDKYNFRKSVGILVTGERGIGKSTIIEDVLFHLYSESSTNSGEPNRHYDKNGRKYKIFYQILQKDHFEKHKRYFEDPIETRHILAEAASKSKCRIVFYVDVRDVEENLDRLVTDLRYIASKNVIVILEVSCKYIPHCRDEFFLRHIEVNADDDGEMEAIKSKYRRDISAEDLTMFDMFATYRSPRLLGDFANAQEIYKQKKREIESSPKIQQTLLENRAYFTALANGKTQDTIGVNDLIGVIDITTNYNRDFLNRPVQRVAIGEFLKTH